MLLTLLSLSLAPGILIAIYFYIKDKFEKEPLKAIMFSFFLGCVSTIPTIIIESFLLRFFPSDHFNIPLTIIETFIIVAGTEELCKFLMLKYYSKKSNFNEPYDGIFYGVIISLGFAGVENILYVLEGGVSVGFLRMFTAVPGHAMFGAIMGYYFGMAWQYPKKRVSFIIKGLASAVFIHGLYDFFLFQKNFSALWVLSLVTLLFVWQLVRKAIKIHNSNSPHEIK